MIKKASRNVMIANILCYLIHTSFIVFSLFNIFVFNRVIFFVSLIFSFIFAIYHLFYMLTMKRG